jgi:hypothetical protein
MQTRERAHPPTRVVHHKLEPYDVYVGRGGPWGNVYSHSVDSAAQHVVGSREEAVAAFERDLLADVDRVALVRSELRGKVLGCWCEPKLCHGRVLARVADSDGPIEPAFQLDPRLGPSIEVDPDPLDTLPKIDADSMFGGRKVVCLDVETDARYSDLGVGRLVCMAFSFDGKHTQTVDADTAVELFRKWIIDDDLLLFGQSIYSDLAVLAQASFRKATGVDCVPGMEWAYELVHRAYDKNRIVDTEIRTRLTYIRFGPHKAAPGLGATVKQFFGIDIADAKTLGKKDKEETSALLTSARPWSEWTTELFDRIPWRFKYGSLIGVPIPQWPAAAREYVADDVRWPWHVYRRQQQLWTASGVSAIPDERRQTLAAWHLHLLAIPGWLADRERAQRIREIYRKVVAHCERTLVQAGIVEITPSVLKLDDARVRGLIVDALGERAKLPETYAKSNPNPTIDQLRAHCSTDADAIKKTLAVVDRKPVKLDSKVSERNDDAVTQAVAELDAGTLLPLQALGLWKAREKLAEIVGPALASRAVELATVVLVDAGLLAWTIETRTTKKQRISQRVFVALGDQTPLTKKAAKVYSFPTLEQREQFASSDKKAVREAVLESGAIPLNVVDAVDHADASPEEFDAWLAESRAVELNAYALHTTAKKTITSFLDKLDVDTRIRTTYQTVIESGRTASRGGSKGSGAVNVQQMPRDNGKPGHLHIRGCILPDPGWVFVVADYSQVELCALGHVLTELIRFYARNPARRAHAEKLLGFPIDETYSSTLARAINEGKDCHLLMAGTLLGKSYEYCVAQYERAEAKKKAKQPLTPEESEVVEARQLSKACNFGFPGGLGAKKFIDYAAAYGVPITLDRAEFAKRSYMIAWPEMKLYFDFVAEKCAAAGPRGAVCRQLGSNRLRGDCNFNQLANCLDEETEALTKDRGWVRGFDLHDGDVILAKDATTGELRWEQATINKFPNYTGDLHTFKTASMELVSTPDHRWLVYDKKTGRDVVKRTHEISDWGDHRIHLTGRPAKKPERYGAAFCSLAGWVLTDGSIRKSSVCLYQSKPDGVRKIRDVLQACALSYTDKTVSETAHVFYIHACETTRTLQSLFPKRVLTSEFLAKLAPTELQALLDAMLAGDGHYGKHMCTPTPERRDMFQMLCTLAGYSSTSMWRPGHTATIKKTGQLVHGKPYWVVTVKRRDKVQVAQGQRSIRHVENARVWCPTVPSSFFVARRKGFVFISGNSSFQGLASDGAKEALASLINASYRDPSSPLFGCRPSAFVHDEFLVSAPAHLAERALPEVERLMVEAMQRWIPNILIQAPGRIMKERWSK